MKLGKQAQLILQLMLQHYLPLTLIMIFIYYGLTVTVISAVEQQVMYLLIWEEISTKQLE